MGWESEMIRLTVTLYHDHAAMQVFPHFTFLDKFMLKRKVQQACKRYASMSFHAVLMEINFEDISIITYYLIKDL